MGESGPVEDHVLARLILERGWVSPDQLRDAYRLVGKDPSHGLSSVLLKQGLISASQIADLRREVEGPESGAARGDLATPPTSRKPPHLKPPTSRSTQQTALHSGRTSQIAESTGTEVPEAVLRKLKDPAACFDKFVLVEELGRGGMGVVWKAWQRDLKRWVAIKFLTADDEEELQRFCREAQTAAGLSHPNICAIHDLGERAGRYYIVMEYIDGPSLHQLGKLNPERALKILRDAALALHHAHERGVIHRDIKPHNVMVARDGRVYVMDFGLAKAVRAGEGMTLPGMVLGTPSYMPPEQAEGRNEDISPRSDVYSLGATLFSALTGRQPFSGRTPVEILQKVLHNPVPTLRSPGASTSSIPVDLDAVVQRALQKDPLKRYSSAKAFADDLDRVLKGQPLAGVRKPARRSFLRTPAGIVSAVAAGLALTGSIVFALTRPGPKPSPSPSPLAASVSPAPDRSALKSRARPALDRAHRAFDQAAEVLLVEGEKWEKLVEGCRKAEAAAEEALRILPDHEDALLVRGRARALREDFEGAERDLMAALKADPNLSAGERELGAVYLRRAELAVRGRALQDEYAQSDTPEARRLREQALSHFKRFAELSSDTLDVKFARASLDLLESHPAEALRKATELIQESPRPEYYLLRSRAQAALNRPKEALADAEEVLRRQRNHFDVMRHMAMVRYRAGDLDQAVKEIDRLLALKPDDAQATTLRASCLARSGRLEEAMRGLADDPTLNANHLFTRAWTSYLAGKRDEAMRDIEAILKDRPDDTEALDLKALMLLGADRYAEAIRVYDQIVKVDPGSSSGYSGRAAMKVLTEDYLGAHQDADAALRLDPEDTTALVSRGKANRKLGRRDAAVADYRAAAKRPPSKSTYWSVIMDELDDAEAYELMLEIVDRFEAAPFDHPDLLLWRGIALSGLKKPDEARKALEAAHRRNPSDWEPYYELGSLEKSLRRFEEAIRWYTVGLKVKPTSITLLQARGLTYLEIGKEAEALADLKAAAAQSPLLARELAEHIRALEARVR